MSKPSNQQYYRGVVFLLKILLTLGFTLIVLFSEVSLFKEVELLGLTGAIVIGVIFFILVAYYCRSLQKTLQLISPHHRICKPKSVWLMFLIPYNFIEDFFIILHVSKSIENQAKDNKILEKYAPYGKYSGLAWCSFQILSITPNYLGQIATVIALMTWLIHRRFIVIINQQLTNH